MKRELISIIPRGKKIVDDRPTLWTKSSSGSEEKLSISGSLLTAGSFLKVAATSPLSQLRA